MTKVESRPETSLLLIKRHHLGLQTDSVVYHALDRTALERLPRGTSEPLYVPAQQQQGVDHHLHAIDVILHKVKQGLGADAPHLNRLGEPFDDLALREGRQQVDVCGMG